jgi:hypothetical protein
MGGFDDAYDKAKAKREAASRPPNPAYDRGGTTRTPSPKPSQGGFGKAYDRAKAKRESEATTPGSRTTPSPKPTAPTIEPLQLAGTETDGPALDAVSWIIDLLNRGAYASKQFASNVADESITTIQKINAGQDPLFAQLEGMGRTWGKSLVGDDSYAHAFFGNDLDRKGLGSDLIEESTDKYGKAFNPNYVDRVDNADPLTKGAGGLVFDIFADATNYLPGKVLTYPVTGAAKVAYHGGKALPLVGKTAAAQAIPGARALGFNKSAGSRVATMRAWDAAQEVRAAAEAKVAGQTIPPGAAPAQHAATANIPSAAPKTPAMGATGVAQRATPAAPLNPIAQAVLNVAKMTGTGATKLYGAASRAADRIIGDVPPPPKVPNTFNEMSVAEATVHHAEAAVVEEARQEAVQETVQQAAQEFVEPVVRNPRQAGRRATRPGDQTAPAPRAPEPAPEPAPAQSLDERLVDQQKEAGGAIPIPGSVVPEASPVVVRDPLPEGARADLDVEMSKGRRVTASGAPSLWQAKALKDLSGTDVPKDVVKRLLDMEHTGKLNGAESTVLENIRYEAAIVLRKAKEAETHNAAAGAAGGVPKKNKKQVGKIVSVDDLYDILRKSSYIEGVKKFVDLIATAEKKTVQTPLPRYKTGPKAGGIQGGFDYKDGSYVGTGLFDPKFDRLRESAMHHWLSESGDFGKHFNTKKAGLTLRDGRTNIGLTAPELRALVARLSGDENAVLLRDGVTGAEFKGPEGLTEVEGQIVEALWKQFYKALEGGRITTAGAEESILIADAVEAMKFMSDFKYAKLVELLGGQTAAKLKDTFDSNPARVIDHFEALSRVADDNFSVQQLDEILYLGKYQMNGQSILGPLFRDIGEYPDYKVWLEAKRAENGVVTPPNLVPTRPPLENQVATPPKAVPSEVAPDRAAKIVSQPSTETPHPVGVEGVMTTTREVRAEAVATGEVWKADIIDALLAIFERTVLKPQGLSHNPAKNLFIESANSAAKAYRTDLWNLPKQLEFANMVQDILAKNFDDLKAASGGKQGPYREMGAYSLDKSKSGVDWDLVNKFEDDFVVEALEISDDFLSKMGVHQVIGVDKESALNLTLGNIFRAIRDHTSTPTGIFGTRGATIRRLLLTGPAGAGSSKANLTALTEAIRIKLTGGSREDVIAALTTDRKLGTFIVDGVEHKRADLQGPMPLSASKGGATDLGRLPNNFNNPGFSNPSKHFRQIGDAAKSEWKAIFPNATFRDNVKKVKGENKVSGVWMEIPGSDLANATADLIDEMTQDLGEVALKNGWHGRNADLEGADIIMGDLVGANFKALSEAPERTPELIEHLASLGKIADDVAEKKLLTDNAARVAEERAKAEVGPTIADDAKREVDIANAPTPGAGTKTQQAQTATAISKAQHEIADEVQESAHQLTQDHLSELLNDPTVLKALDEDVVEPVNLAAMQSPMEDTNPWMMGVPETRSTDADVPYEIWDDPWGNQGMMGSGPMPSAGGAGRGTTPPASTTPSAGGSGGRGANIGTPAHVAAADEVTQVFDMNAPYEYAYLSALGRMVFNTGKHFNASLGMKGLWQGVHGASVLSSSYLAKVNDDLSAMSKELGKDTLDTAFSLIQKSGTHSDPKVLRAMKLLNEKLNLLWDTQGDAVLGNAFLGTEPMVEHLNDLLRKNFSGSNNKVPEFNVSEAQELVDANPGMTLGEALSVQWRSWDVSDAPDFVNRLMSAAVNVAEQRAVVNLFDTNMAKWGGSSTTPVEGWAKPTASGRSSFIHYINQDLYYPKALLNELRHADIFVSASRQVAGDGAKWIHNVYAPVLNSWKRAMTINRPGHHARNFIGDMVMTYVVRGHYKSAESALDAAKIHASAGKYTDMDFMVLLRDMHKEKIGVRAPHEVEGEVQIPKFNQKLFTGTVNGADEDITIGRMSDLLHEHGLRPTYIAGEGLFDNAEMAGKVSKWAKVASLENTAYGRGMGTLSQARDHYQRTQHFMQVIRQETNKSGRGRKFDGQWKTLDELAVLAAKEVKRYHPDASMLTPGEAKIMRLIFPFYSWQAKIMPAFFESFIRYPGRVSNLSKLQYEAAVAGGVNPDTVYDPFPTDQNFPDYLQRKVLGPQIKMPGTGEYVGIDPGIPQFDMLNDFLGVEGGPMSQVLGSVTPFARAPFEYASGQQVGGVPILDKSEFLDSQIPGASYFNNITGTSLTGTLMGEGLTGDTAESDPNHENFFDPRRQVKEGNYQGPINEFGLPSSDALRALNNWIFGLSVTGMSHENQMGE